MNVPPTPTSPKSRSSKGRDDLHELLRDGTLHQLAQPNRPRISLATLLVSLVIGFVAGILGELVLNAYLLEQSGVQVVTQNVARNKSDRNTDALLAANKAVVGVVRLPLLSGTAADALPSDAVLGSGILLTDDGWGVSSGAILQTGVSYAAVTADRRVLEIKHRIDDPASDLVFFQIDGGNYPVAALAETGVADDEPLVALAGSARQTAMRERGVTVEQRHARRSGVLETSDAYSRFSILGDRVPAAFVGGPVLDARGRVVGVLVDGGTDETGAVLLPARAVGRILPTLLSEKKVRRPMLGVRFIDLGATAGIPSSLRFGRDTGALVSGTADLPAVLAGSPAAGAGIKSGDLLVRIEDRTLSEQVSLDDIIQDYQPGTVITIKLLRDGKEQEVRLNLNEQIPN